MHTKLQNRYLDTSELPLPMMIELVISINQAYSECDWISDTHRPSTLRVWIKHLQLLTSSRLISPVLTAWQSPSQSLYLKCVKDLVLFVWFLESISSFLHLCLIHHLKNLCRDPAMLKQVCQTDGRVWQKWIYMSSWGASWETTPY